VGMVAPIDLSYDHRLIDGSLGQRFLSELIRNLESTESENGEVT
jgi:pyruvate/2-oxoglutarate dehydrogenase complex dihydrolipoamide acyltransferase (E2) component